MRARDGYGWRIPRQESPPAGAMGGDRAPRRPLSGSEWSGREAPSRGIFTRLLLIEAR
jgi:hypothetical protein